MNHDVVRAGNESASFRSTSKWRKHTNNKVKIFHEVARFYPCNITVLISFFVTEANKKVLFTKRNPVFRSHVQLIAILKFLRKLYSIFVACNLWLEWKVCAGTSTAPSCERSVLLELWSVFAFAINDNGKMKLLSSWNSNWIFCKVCFTYFELFVFAYPLDPKELLQARQSGLLTWLTREWQGYKETSRKLNQNWQWIQKPSLLWNSRTYMQFHMQSS